MIDKLVERFIRFIATHLFGEHWSTPNPNEDHVREVLSLLRIPYRIDKEICQFLDKPTTQAMVIVIGILSDMVSSGLPIKHITIRPLWNFEQVVFSILLALDSNDANSAWDCIVTKVAEVADKESDKEVAKALLNLGIHLSWLTGVKKGEIKTHSHRNVEEEIKMKNRLLTQEELKLVPKRISIDIGAILEAQDKKTLKAVSKWLADITVSGNAVANELKIVEGVTKLKRGEMPK